MKNLIALIAFCLLSVSCMTVQHSRESIQLLIAEEGNLDVKDSDGSTALIWAAYSGHIEELNALIKAGADIAVKDKYGWTALIHASFEGSTEIAKILIDAGADIDEITSEGRTALIWASIKGSTEIAKILIEAGADIDEIDLVIRDGIVASRKTSVDLEEEAYAERTGGEYDPDHYYLEWGNETALMHATIYEHPEIAKMLIEAGANLDEINVDGETALIIASRKGHPEIAKMLIEAGANLDIKTVAQREIIETIERNEGLIYAIIKEFSSDYDPSPYIYTYGYRGKRTALMCAASRGYTEIVKSLIDAGANIDEIDVEGYTALTLASIFKYTDIINLLKEAGAQ